MAEIKTASEKNCDCYLCDGCGEVETVDRESNRVTVPCPECMSREIAEERAEAAVLSANAGKVDAEREMTYEELRSTYAGQCLLTDELAKKLAAGSDKALLARISELESDLATMNQRYISASGGESSLRVSAQRNLLSFLKHSNLDGANLASAISCVEVLAAPTQQAIDAGKV